MLKRILSSAVLLTSLQATALDSPMEIPNCKGTNMTRQDYINVVAPGEITGKLAELDIYVFGRKCHALSGCGKWFSADDRLVEVKDIVYASWGVQPVSDRTVTATVIFKDSKRVAIELTVDTPVMTKAANEIRAPLTSIANVEDGQILDFGSFHTVTKHTFGSKPEIEGTAGNLAIGTGDGGRYGTQNYVNVDVQGVFYKEGCVRLSKITRTAAIENGNYFEYDTVLTNQALN